MDKTFGQFFKQKRQEKNLTQKELSKLLFVSESTISKWEKDVARPDMSLLPKLSEILGVSEHELITASIDEKARKEKAQARKWRNLSTTWSLFFYIAYGLALVPCFICNLAVNRTLSWFWIVLSALLLAFTFTNLPKLIKKLRLLLIPLSNFVALMILLATCAIYTHGNWFWITALSILLGFIIIFLPIFIAKYPIFSKLKKANDFFSIAVDFVVLNILLLVIDAYSVNNGFASAHWFLTIALPITAIVYGIINLFLCVRFFKFNRFIKTAIILLTSNALAYIVPLFIKVKNANIQRELDKINVFNADLSKWIVGQTIEQNVHLIICLSILAVTVGFLIVGLILHFKRKKKSK